MIFRKTLLLIFNLFSFSLLPTVSSSEIENQLRSYLFEDYNKYVRPVNDYSSPLNVTMDKRFRILNLLIKFKKQLS